MTDEPMTREDAERICKAHGWTLDCRDRPIEEGYWPLVRGWAEGTDEPICLPPAILAALDPDRPPPPSELKKLTQLEAAALEFCRRVESGEIRSRRSYQAFKVALGEKPATICDHDWAIKDGHCWVCDAEWPEVGDG